MSFDASNETGGASVETAAQGKVNGGGVGTITLVESFDNTVMVTNGAGPTVDLSLQVESTDNTVLVTNPSPGVTNLRVATPIAATWRTAMLAFLQSLVSGLVNDGDPFLDFLFSGNSAAIGVTASDWVVKQPDADTSATATVSSTLNGGVLVCTTVANSLVGASGLQVFKQPVNLPVPFVANMKTNIWAIVSRCAMRPSTFDGNTYVRPVMCSLANFSNAVAFGVAAGATFLDLYDGAVSTVSAVAPDNQIWDWALINDGTNLRAYRGQILGAGMGSAILTVPVTANVPTGPGIAMAQVRELAGGAPAQQILVDKLWGIGSLQS